MDACQTGAGVSAAACVRAIDRDFSCRVTNDRMSYMTAHRPDCAGKSILEMLWDELMSEMEPLMSGGEYHDDSRPDGSRPMDLDLWTAHRARTRGVCQGLSAAIAIMMNPYAPNVDQVRAEAAERYENQ